MTQYTVNNSDITSLSSSGAYSPDTADKLFDGLSNTYWNSYVSDENGNTWFLIELKNSIKIDKIVFQNIEIVSSGAYGLKNYKIQASNDGVIFDDIYIGYSENKFQSFLEVPLSLSVAYKYIRFEALDSWSSEKRVYFSEFKIYYTTHRKLALKNPSTNQHYSLAEKTLIPLTDSSDKNMISFGIETGKEIKLDEDFDKINYPVEGVLKSKAKTMVKPLSIKFEQGGVK